MSNQTKNKNLNYLIDPTFTTVNRLFVLSFEIEHGRILEDDRIYVQSIIQQTLKKMF